MSLPDTELAGRNISSRFWAVMKYAKSYKAAFVLSVLLLAADIVYDVGYAWVQQWFIDAAGTRDIDRLLMLTGVCFAAGIAIIIFFMLQFYLRNSVQSFMQRDMSVDVFRKITSLPYPSVLRYHTGDLVSRATRDVQQANGMIANIVYELSYNVALFAVAFGYLATIDWRLALVVTASAPVIFFIGRLFDKRLRTLGQVQQQKDAEVRGLLQETMQGISIVRLFQLESLFTGKYERRRKEQNRLHMRQAMLQTTMNQSVYVTNQLITIACAFFTAHLAIQGTLTAGQILAFLVLINRVQSPLLSVINTWGNFQQGLGAGDRLAALDEEPSEAGGNGLAREQMASGESGDSNSSPETEASKRAEEPIRLCRAAAVVPVEGKASKVLLSDISLTVRKGEFLAIVGPSGAGKSTALRLCSGLIKPSSGLVEVLGLPVQEHLDAIRQRTSYVPQTPYLFTGTVRENLTLGVEDYTEEEMVQAAKTALAHEFIEQLDGGYDALVGERGGTLSGGQKQRLAIARAIIRRPEIVLLDESTSALDMRTEREVIHALLEALPDVTFVFVSHRMTAIERADRIVVMEQGGLVEKGTHAELMAMDGLYSMLYRIQQDQSEAASTTES
ncbi:ABC transporter ATP-binding protein [Paenibacillus sp. GCM10012307]|uniref:ABC transporter ATP-binding protein n=1 Tax=Paenibacillus roseus TaxID=2798579 RepID=A0A934MMJ1_9BACL|nr:ABC transporter ATP-binding protein [Paenibacillus roseus]MBJ6359996.1 ABC transporter ATP-binding protein [Paenibacillus roseus]